MKKRAPRITAREWDVIYNCLAFVEAGEVDGGPLEGDDDEETAENVKLFESAKRKIAER